VPTHIALLRAVNLGAHNAVPMADLRDLLSRLGFGNVQSLLQTGNLVFQSAATGAKLEALLENEATKRLKLETDFFVRSAREWEAIVTRNPFPREAARDPAHLLVTFLKEAPDPKRVKALQAAITGPEVVRTVGTQAYITYPNGIGRSRVTMALIERTLGTRGTGRNWNTVLKLGALAAAQ
jgi:uncharacterized protein (DUF1697 family)